VIGDDLNAAGASVPFRHDLIVRVIPFAIGDGNLEVALATGDPSASAPTRLPTGALASDETLGRAASRIAAESIGAIPDYLEQLYTFNIPGSTPQIIVAYFALISAQTRATVDRTTNVVLAPVDRLPPVSPIDAQFIGYATTRLRAKLGYSNVAFHFVPQEFTLSDLQIVYESVLGQQLDKRNFRRRILAAEIIESVGTKRPTSHRPATLYRFVGGDPSSGALIPEELDRSLR
jgi:8-oxo-dGTP diphosphatase